MTVYFDLDGTLIDSTERHWKLLSEVLMKFNISKNVFYPNEYMEYKRNGNNTCLYLMRYLGLEEQIAKKICDDWVAHIEDEKYLQYDALYEEAFDVLNRLKREKMEIVYLSARNNKSGTMAWLRKSGIENFAKDIYIVDSSNALENKISAIKPMVSSDDIFIGDTEVDWELGEFFSAKTYVLNRGFRSKQFWEKKNIDSYANIGEVLSNLLVFNI